MPEPQGTRIPAPRVHPPHAPKAMSNQQMIPDGLLGAFTHGGSFGAFALSGCGQSCANGPAMRAWQVAFEALRMHLLDQVSESRSGLCKVGLLDRLVDDPLKFTGEDTGPFPPTGPFREQSFHASKRPVSFDQMIQSGSADAEVLSNIRHVAGCEASTMAPQQLSDGLVPPTPRCPDRRLNPVLVLRLVAVHPLLRATRGSSSGSGDRAATDQAHTLFGVPVVRGTLRIFRPLRRPANLCQLGFYARPGRRSYCFCVGR